MDMREVKVTYANGDVVHTSMAAGLTDKEILNYFAVGKAFNIGAGEYDNMQRIVKTEIIK
jgi:hypothetical protein